MLNISAGRWAKTIRPRDWIRTWKVQPGDHVEVISGKDKMKRGSVLAIDKRRNQVKVSGCNERTIKGSNGAVTKIEKKIHYSNVMVVDPVENVPTRTSLQFAYDGAVFRVSKKSGQIIHWPEKRTRDWVADKGAKENPEKDTFPEKALEKTYNYWGDVEALRQLRQSLTKYNHEIGK